MSTTYQLTSIVLIDSFWAGQTVLLNVDGHTSLNGTNGAGKTTFLRLMQLFWGERPSNIVGSTGSKKGFIDHYLPRDCAAVEHQYKLNKPVETSRIMGVDDYFSIIQHHHNSGKKWIACIRFRVSERCRGAATGSGR